MPGAPQRLRCELLENPMGVTCHPRLSWWVDDPRPAELQSGFEILAASSCELLQQDTGNLWRSGRVERNDCGHVDYEGLPLTSGQIVWWKVRTFDSDGLSSPWSQPAHFEMGLLSESDWQARWIAAPLSGSRTRGVQVVALRREFECAALPSRARLYVAALGDARVRVNGQAPGDSAGAIWSDFAHAHYYQTFDVTALIAAGANAVGVLLSDGFYAGHVPGIGRENFGQRPALRLLVSLEFADGRHQVVSTDHQWRWRPSWILNAEVNAGEHVDGRQYISGWDAPGLLSQGWNPVDTLPDMRSEPHSLPVSGPLVRQALRPQHDPPPHAFGGRATLVFDFGDHVVGRVRLELMCADQDEVVVHYAADEAFALRTEDSYTSRGNGVTEVFEPAFAVHSFRFVRVTFSAEVTSVESALALRVAFHNSSAMQFRSDHPTLNRLFEVLHNSLQAVSFSAPLRGAAPQESTPDIGYAGTWVPELARQPDAHWMISKWINDIKLGFVNEDHGACYGSGRLPVPGDIDQVARYESFVRILWALYRYQNDRDALKRCYPELRVAALGYRHRYPELVREGVREDLYGAGYSGELVATCTLYGALKLTGRIAGVLGNLGDYELLENLAEEVRKAFRRRYLTADGHLLGDNQSAYVAALYHNLLDGAERRLAEHRLIALVQDQHYHSDVVPVVIHALLPVLTAAGRLDVAYMLLLQTSQPSWLANVNNSGGLIARAENRFDIAEAGLYEWLVQSLVGVALERDYSVDNNGYRNTVIRPTPPLGAGFLAGAPVEFVQAVITTLCGRLEVSWFIRDQGFELELLIPPSCTATVALPDGIQQRVQSGRHRFSMDFEAGGDGIPTLMQVARVGRRETR